MRRTHQLAAALIAVTTYLNPPLAHADKAALEAAKAAKEAARRKQETGSFAQFNPTASARDEVNTYFLSYLSLMVYPQNLAAQTGTDEDQLQTSRSLFETTYKNRVAHMFPASTKFKFFEATTRELYNPEAMVIATDAAILVIFRGTDRVANNGPGILGDVIFDVGEWLVTDLNVQPLRKPRQGLPGKLHRGMKESLDAIADDLTRYVLDNGGASKPVWVTGHSLGGGHAQIMGGYLAKSGADVRGVYVYNSPHPGDPAFAAGLDATLGQAAIQRFEYLDDPIAMLAPQTSATQLLTGLALPLPSLGTPVGGFGRAGVRNFYAKLDGKNFFGDQAERVEGRIQRTDRGRSGAIDPLSICFHNPHWIAQASFRDLPAATQEKLPPPPSLSDVEACTDMALELGKTGVTPEVQLARDTAEAIGDTVSNAVFNAANIAANLAGTAIEEGDYYIRANRGGKYLDISGSCMDDNGCKAQLWELGKSRTNNVFHVAKSGPSYRVTLKRNGKSLEVDGRQRQDDGARIQIWDGNPIGVVNANQKWFFYRVPGSRNQYLLVNAASFKVLDADNGSVEENGGGVHLRGAASNDQTQVWLLEKAN